MSRNPKSRWQDLRSNVALSPRELCLEGRMTGGTEWRTIVSLIHNRCNTVILIFDSTKQHQITRGNGTRVTVRYRQLDLFCHASNIYINLLLDSMYEKAHRLPVPISSYSKIKLMFCKTEFNEIATHAFFSTSFFHRREGTGREINTYNWINWDSSVFSVPRVFSSRL